MVSKDEIIRQIEEVRRRRKMAERKLLTSGRSHPLYNEAEIELTLEEYQREGSSTRSIERLTEMLEEENCRYTNTLTYF